MHTKLYSCVTCSIPRSSTCQNPRAEMIFGWVRGEALGQKLANLIIPPRYRERHERGVHNFLRTGEGVALNRSLAVTGLRRDGTEFPLELSISPLKLGETYEFHAFLSDITDRKRGEENRVRMASIVESSADAIIGKTLDGIVTSWNGAAEHTFGYTAEEAIGTPIGCRISKDRLEEESKLVERVKRGETISHFYTVRRSLASVNFATPACLNLFIQKYKSLYNRFPSSICNSHWHSRFCSRSWVQSHSISLALAELLTCSKRSSHSVARSRI